MKRNKGASIIDEETCRKDLLLEKVLNARKSNNFNPILA